MPIVSVSGIRGIVNHDLDSSLVESVGLRFGTFLKAGKVALACDTRSTSFALKAAVGSGLVRAGCFLYDLGFSSTPSVFKEVSVENLDGGVIVTASHNPPKWNGLKFVVKDGRGVFENELQAIMTTVPREDIRIGKVFRRTARYLEILQASAGIHTALGVKVALDLAGGVGSLFIGSVIASQGCQIHTMHNTPGIFPRIIDPTVDPLLALSNIVKTQNCDVGFAYDCDADRLVIVDQNGNKMSGDATLLICLRYFLDNTRNRRVAVSVDTSLAAEDLVREYNGQIVYSKVGEANVVRKIIENNCGAGGEGSSGGYIEPAFVMCRDGVHASTMITRMIKSEGSLSSITSGFKKYFQDRAKLEIDTALTQKILQSLSQTESDVDVTDGVKVRRSAKSWVLVRGSNTENVIRVSAESDSEARSSELVKEFSKKINDIAGHLRQNSSS
jgi:phosphomannomutase